MFYIEKTSKIKNWNFQKNKRSEFSDVLWLKIRYQKEIMSYRIKIKTWVEKCQEI